MATTPATNIVDAVILSTTITPLYTVTTNLLRVKLDSVTFTNYGSVNALLTAQIITKGSTASDEKILIKEKEIRAGESYLAPELLGHGIGEGGSLSAFSSVAATISCTATATAYST